MNRIVNKRYFVIFILLITTFIYITYNLYNIQILNNKYYKKRLNNLSVKEVMSSSVPRGRIYDRNYNLLVDNVGVKTIYFMSLKGINEESKIKTAKILAKNIDVDYSKLTNEELKEYYYVNNKKLVDLRITNEEKENYNKRKLTLSDLKKLKFKRIKKSEISSLNELDKESAYIYYLINKGYYYDEKIIKTYATDEEYAYVAANKDKLKGVNIKLEWERKYLYGDTFRTILGNVSDSSSGIPLELKDKYIKEGYSLNDRVGTTYLEYQYEKYLKGEKSIYKLNDDNSYTLEKEGVRGNDIVLTIDINIQKEVEQILDEEIRNAKNDMNTSLYDGSRVIVSDPNTGEILAMASKEFKDGKMIDNTPVILTNPVTPGSIVKGASISTGYKSGAISIGEKMADECVKLSGVVKKCSWTSLGYLNDKSAIAYSSNSFQYKTAIKVTGNNYYYNMSLSNVDDAFKSYREMFKEYGLGVKTNIDLPVESLGQKGTNDNAGTLLDFSIGQYDTYTPIQITQYINAIAASGNKYQLHLLKEVRKGTNKDQLSDIIYQNKNKLIGKVDISDEYMNRVRESFNAVMNAIGNGYMGDAINPSGKTGTSQSFYDIDNDGKVDVETLSKAFIGYAPADNPKYSIVVLSPNVRYSPYSEYVSPVNYNISSRVSNKVFEILK